jgi:hypothetical protein
MTVCIRRLALVLFGLAAFVCAGHAAEYAPAKVVYDVSSGDPAVMQRILDRASLLQDLYGNNPFEASIVIVVHEGAIPLFSVREPGRNRELIDRAHSLSLGEVIRFAACRASAKMQGYEDGDLAEFVAMVPMADAEIVRLQRAGYAYLR